MRHTLLPLAFALLPPLLILSCNDARHPSAEDTSGFFEVATRAVLQENSATLVSTKVLSFGDEQKTPHGDPMYPFTIKVTIGDGRATTSDTFDCLVGMEPDGEWVLMPGEDGSKSPVSQMQNLLGQLQTLH